MISEANAFVSQNQPPPPPKTKHKRVNQRALYFLIKVDSKHETELKTVSFRIYVPFVTVRRKNTSVEVPSYDV